MLKVLFMQNGNNQYGALDVFKFIAAILVITVHIGPLLQLSSQLDFVLTGIIARIAVPFFFMTTGFFALAPVIKGEKKLSSLLKKYAFYYLIAILIYLPINIYAHQLPGINFLEWIRFIFMDGTFYHLWYFPALIIGLVITYWISTKTSIKMSLAISVLLFVIGLFGDSYYGYIANQNFISSIYDIGFNLFTYTRNGLFFAPLFLMLGAYSKLRNRESVQQHNLLFFIVFLCCMIIEGIYLESQQLTHHNSMYILLLPTMFFLFEYLKNINMNQHQFLRGMSTWIYILHPMILIGVRGFAKVTGLTDRIVENNLNLFLVCTGVTLIISSCITYFTNYKSKNNDQSRSWIEISKESLEHNVKELILSLPKGCELMPVLKADAYGHDAVMIAKCLQKMNIRTFCVATIDEGIELRKAFIQGDILILGHTAIDRVDELKKYRLTQTIVDYMYAKQLNALKKKIKIHLAIDTGMHRLGIPSDKMVEIIDVINMKNIQLQGIFTHLCCADEKSEEGKVYTELQINRFNHCMELIKNEGIELPKLHVQSSYGLLNYELSQMSYARIGIALYGAVDKTKKEIDLEPVLSLKSRVVAIKRLKKGEGAGYGQLFKASQDMDIAIVSIGYADGLSRQLSCGRGKVILHDKMVSIIGRICMDQCMIDISMIPDVQVMDEVILIGKSENHEITVMDIAKQTDTIPNETLVQLKGRLPRILID